MNSYIKTCLKSLGQTGTIAPSSKYLIKEITQNINFDKDLTIVEFGTGDGCITEVLLDKMSTGSQLYSFELNEDFFDFSTKKFKSKENLNLFRKSALNFASVPDISKEASVDIIVSSLPLTLFDQSEIDQLMSKVKNSLKPNGRFIQYQYSLGKWFYLKNLFGDVRLDFTVRNLPPAVVYSCTLS